MTSEELEDKLRNLVALLRENKAMLQECGEAYPQSLKVIARAEKFLSEKEKDDGERSHHIEGPDVA